MASPKGLPTTRFGLLGMTWRPKVTPDEQAFPAMKAAIANGATIWSSSSIYGMPPEKPTAGLSLLRRYFEKYPEDASKVTLFIRACFDTQAVCPVRVVEVEFSLWSTEILTNGVAATCKDLGVPILTYAPLGYGFLTGQIRKLEDIPQGDVRHMFGRFQPQTFHKNLALVGKVNEFAQRRGITPAQLALAWIRAHSNTSNCGIIIPIPGATAAVRVEENCKEVQLSVEEKQQLDEILESFQIIGERQIVGRNSDLSG
ncbi:Aldo/keto reductase [Aspergillus sclerotiicarbonarius CBS 121057]|uniref:Aldo/keto reductase n=1 Tax=Aspergillus sclerotiicarbonarius (strain CBS 121057 / IBT 28362) TaxID=1448318 RepID=A0A319ECA1_ASPSB|nr:Aldo/keto reductase [Aspergillus sclerotiicarbonarius CBS 121057]